MPEAGKVIALSRHSLLHALRGRDASADRAATGTPAVVGACCHHQVCVAVCPDGALRAWEVDGRVGLALDLTACTGCGRCIVHCPEQALALRPRPAKGANRVTLLTVHRHMTCAECDEPYVAQDDDRFCPLCRKSRSLFTSSAAVPSPRRQLPSQEE
jgi:ferredoxin